MKMGWKVHTPSMLKEILKNPGAEILAQPLQIFANLLADVAKRATELDDPQLNILMMRLTLYEQANPETHTFEAIKAAYEAQEERLTAGDPQQAVQHALEFYANPKRYEGANASPLPDDPFQPGDLVYRLDVTRDGGTIARTALASLSRPDQE